ncbi:MAG: alginate lyase family protein [Bacteroidetes bacterium]|nr:alginate lyase family protein [Bacteroidota bacterium]
MKTKFIYPILFFLLLSGIISAQSWQQIISVEDVCEAYPEKMDYIFQNLNLDYLSLEKIKLAYKKNDLVKACSLLLQYYNGHAEKRFVNKPQPEILRFSTAGVDSILNDIYIFQLVAGKVPRLDDGHLKWDHNGPEDDIEWAWALNRHYPVSYILPHYFKSGDAKYARYIDLFIKDWIIQSWPYPAKKSSTAMWRGLEVSFRVKVWSEVFYGLTNSDYISQATKLLILSSLPDHAHYAREFHAQNNWLTMELSGLANVAAFWPEFKKSEEWLDYSVTTMTESLKGQVYPDGAQNELTSSYHFVALRNFELFSEICEFAGKELPAFFNTTLENMYNYLAMTIRPDGAGILNNDADRNNNVEKVMVAAGKFNREDWKYTSSNEVEGTKPKNGPSFIFPWAGQLISRNDYKKDAHWSFFDIGPWGSGHQHNDKLHISISAYGRDLLVDAGRYAYRGEVAKKFRAYARGTQGHNTILIDGKGQMPDITVADKPLSDNHFKITRNFDYAWNSFDKFYDLEKVEHSRTLFYVRDNFWIVVDNVKTEKPREIETLWHWHPRCEGEKQSAGIVTSVNETGNLKIIPLGITKWDVDLVKGQEKPEIQGWYSEEYNQYEPGMSTIYSTKIESDETFVWLLIPSEKEAPKLKAKIISKNSDGMKLKVTDKQKGTWEITIPYSNSKNAELEFTQNTP